MGFIFGSNPFSSPNLLVPLVMLGWIPIVIYLFSRYPARRAIVISFIVAWLFLPQAVLPLPGLPDYDKMAPVFMTLDVFGAFASVGWTFLC
jgi:hypothetical protein